VNWKGWLITILAVIAIGYLMFANGFFMHGDCIDIDRAPPC